MSGSRKSKGLIVAGILLVVLLAGIATAGFQVANDQPHEVPTFPADPAENPDSIWTEDGKLKENSLAFAVFEEYGLVLVPLALLMFGAMVGGVVISREEVVE